jgi:hypothetical protein
MVGTALTRARASHLLIAALLLLARPSTGGETAASSAERWRSFIPAGWASADCPASYGKEAVLCAGTDTGPFKVDRHIPTLSVRAPTTACQQARKDFVAIGERFGVTVARSTSGRCGPSAWTCTELRLKDSRPTDPVAGLVYVSCPANGPVEIFFYAVSARVIDAFEPVARQQARWKTGR